MTMLLATAALTAAQPVLTAPPAPPAPPMITMTAPPAPPSPSDYRRAIERLTRPPAILDVRVSSEAGMLWQGSLRVGPSGARISDERVEAEAANCPHESTSFGRSVHTSFLLNLSAAGYPEGDDLYSVNVGWTRVPGQEACALDGNRTVQFQTSIRIPVHGSATLHGDAGLTVEIRRR